MWRNGVANGDARKGWCLSFEKILISCACVWEGGRERRREGETTKTSKAVNHYSLIYNKYVYNISVYFS